MSQRLILITGLPGSGKSTAAQAYKSRSEGDSVIVEADHYFDTPEGYQFDPRKLPEAHTWCHDTAQRYLSKGWTVIVANTFSRQWELDPYVKMAGELGVPVEVYTMPDPGTDVLAARNIHHVPAEVIDRMRARWEVKTPAEQKYTEDTHND